MKLNLSKSWYEAQAAREEGPDIRAGRPRQSTGPSGKSAIPVVGRKGGERRDSVRENLSSAKKK